MLSRLRFAVSPGWLVGHLVSLALIVTMVLLGRWQLDVSNSKHFSVQNFGYALQWWAFSTFVAVMWARVLRDRMRAPLPDQIGAGTGPGSVVKNAEANAEATGPVEQPVAYRRYIMPSALDMPALDIPAVDARHAERDSERALYNDYLARLARGDR
ncbi:MAG: hypothetical protein M3N95_09975 [Actinomycetota bacterium]|nr:hypothetical protein [Actinomycetota bacterium]